MNRFLNVILGGKWSGSLAGLASLIFMAGPSFAHFLYLVPTKDCSQVQVVFSENLTPDDRTAIGKAASLKLNARAHGQDVPLVTTKGKQCLGAQLPEGTTLVFGTMVHGLMSRGETSSLLIYHPKLLLGDASEPIIGEKMALEIVPHQHGSRIRYQLLYQGNPVAEAEGTIVLPNGAKQNLKTDHEGFTGPFSGKGRYGLWMRHVLAKAGEYGGKKYSEEKHYATLVGHFSSGVPDLTPLPTALSSLGATTCDGHLYVYGGQRGITYANSTRDVVGDFRRLDLTDGKVWESLPGGPIAQGLSLVSHRGKIIRVGGMQPRNEPGQPEDHLSLASCARFDPKTNLWTDLPPLPAGRSSHEAVIAGDKIVVVGGWQLKGGDYEPVWHDTALIMDLAQSPLQWRSIPQPFKRRALSAAAVGREIYVLCGLGEGGVLHNSVDILDLETGKWSAGPEVPGEQVAFSPAAVTVNGQLLFNGFDGPLYRLESGGNAWQKVANASRPRMVHRAVPHANGVLLVGGATPDGNVADLDFLAPSQVAGLSVSLGINK